VKTTALPAATPQDIVRRRSGGQPGNRNALKTGAHTKEARVLRKRVTSARRAMKLLIGCVKEEFGKNA
jgi:hypothetical protein